MKKAGCESEQMRELRGVILYKTRNCENILRRQPFSLIVARQNKEIFRAKCVLNFNYLNILNILIEFFPKAYKVVVQKNVKNNQNI
jgi:hypothetical protein